MRRIIHLKKRNNKKNLICIILLLLLISVFYCFRYINKKVTPVLMEYAVSETTKLATVIITEAVDNKVFKNIETADLFYIEKDNNNNIRSVDLNSAKINKILNLITNSIKEYLECLENGDIQKLKLNEDVLKNKKFKKGVIYEIPSGAVFNNSFLSNLGPHVPVRMNMVGDIETNIDTNITNYGINNALLKVIVNIKVSLKVILPFSSKVITTETDVPIAMKLISGEVPSYYYSPISSS